MRIRLSVHRQDLPAADVLWALSEEQTRSMTIAQLLEDVNKIIPLEADQRGLEDYVVEIDSIRPLHKDEHRSRQLSGRTQITSDGRHLHDGIAFSRPYLLAPRRPNLHIPANTRNEDITGLLTEGLFGRDAAQERASPSERHLLLEDASHIPATSSSSILDRTPGENNARCLRSSSGEAVASKLRNKKVNIDTKAPIVETALAEEYLEDNDSDEDFIAISSSTSDSKYDSETSGSGVVPTNGAANLHGSTESVDSESSDDSSDTESSDSESDESENEKTPSAEKFPAKVSAPFEGKMRTQYRNSRRKMKTRLNSLTRGSALPCGSNFEDLYKYLQSADPEFLQDLDRRKERRVKQALERENQYRPPSQPLATSIASSQATVEAGKADKAANIIKGSQENSSNKLSKKRKAAEVTEGLSDGSDRPNKLQISEETKSSVNPAPLFLPSQVRKNTRPRLDKAAVQRHIFGSLGSRAPNKENVSRAFSNHLSDRFTYTNTNRTAKVPKPSPLRETVQASTITPAEASARASKSASIVEIAKARRSTSPTELDKALKPTQPVGTPKEANSTPLVESVEAPESVPTAKSVESVPDIDSWKLKIHLSAVECCDENLTLRTPPFPFRQYWDAQVPRGSGGKKRVNKGKKRKRASYEAGEEDWEYQDGTYTASGDLGPFNDGEKGAEGSQANGHLIESGFLDYDDGNDLDFEQREQSACISNPKTDKNNGDASAARRQSPDLPPIPADISSYPMLSYEAIQAGMIIYFKRLELSGFMPTYAQRTACVVKRTDKEKVGNGNGNSKGEVEMVLAKRDRKKDDDADEEGEMGKHGLAALEGFEVEGAEAPDGKIVVAWESLIEVKLIE
ncbi:MAG: hypothetical protein M1820_008855 [Bogoriella megaspora]|nr:MAG: hypothetical protein M1820_008855 [Bogoriella megaspora]